MVEKRILIVDDDKDISESLKDILESDGYSVETAETGQEGMEKCDRSFFNLALLDIKLPDMEGTELLTKLPDQKPKMAKIMVTGHANLENAIRSVNMGADAYITKPVRPEHLLKEVSEKLKEQEEAEKMDEKQINEWVITRIKKTKTDIPIEGNESP